MMHWNYRVMKHDDADGVSYSIHEVFYDDDGHPESWTKEPMDPFGEDVEQLRGNLADMARALEFPVLDYMADTDNKAR